MRNKKFWLKTVIVLILLGGIIFAYFRYYSFNKFNIHAQRAIQKALDYRYDEEFKLISIEFETREKEGKIALYVHVWTFTFEDSKGKQFEAYLWTYGMVKQGGVIYPNDWYTYNSDNYGQLCIEECMNKEFELHKFSQNRSRITPDVEDYLFICKEGDETKIAKILTKVFFKEAIFSENGCLLCIVQNENGKILFEYSRSGVISDLKKQGIDAAEITEDIVLNYFLKELEE